MNMPEASFLVWQQQFNTEDDCLEYFNQMKWNGKMVLFTLVVVANIVTKLKAPVCTNVPTARSKHQ